MRRSLLALALLALVPPAAEAGFAGANGKIAYAGKLGGGSALIVREGNRIEAAVDGGYIATPAWSPQGRRIALVRRTAAGKEIWVVDHNGQGLRQVTRAARDATDPAWSPGGGEIAYGTAGRIQAVTADGGAVRDVTRGADPAWSVRNVIAFVRGGDIFTVSSGGGEARRLARTRTTERAPAWSPDGRRLAFVRSGALWLMNEQGRRRLRIARGPVRAPAFSPDGTRVLYSAGRAGSRRILSVRLDGRGLRALSSGGSDGRAADWQPAGFDPVIVAAGDIACDPESKYFNDGAGVPGWCGQLRTSNLLLQQDLWQVLPLGDNQNSDGLLEKFQSVYDPTWGRTKHLQRPVIGNHEYVSGGTGHFDYFNGVGVVDGPAGNRELGGYYSFDIGTWHVVALNSMCNRVPGGCAAGSPQQQWLEQDLARNARRCTMALWHHPRYSSHGGGLVRTDALWDTFAAAGGDVVLTGHHHFYERLAPIEGVRQFVIGVGGGTRKPANGDHPASQVRIETTLGVVRMTLRDGGYDWRFQSASADPATDGGTDTCR